MTRSLTVERIVPGDVSRVWHAWTTAEGLAAWWWAHLSGTTYEVDARVGGTYRIENRAAGIGVRGEYREVEAPHRFAATWIWLDDGEDGEVEQLTVRFNEHPQGTAITVVHAGPWTSDEPMERYRVGWNDVMDALASTAV